MKEDHGRYKVGVLVDMLLSAEMPLAQKKKLLMFIAQHWSYIPKAQATQFEPFKDDLYYYVGMDRGIFYWGISRGNTATKEVVEEHIISYVSQRVYNEIVDCIIVLILAFDEMQELHEETSQDTPLS